MIGTVLLGEYNDVAEVQKQSTSLRHVKGSGTPQQPQQCRHCSPCAPGKLCMPACIASFFQAATLPEARLSRTGNS